jgi:hypothetical protein
VPPSSSKRKIPRVLSVERNGPILTVTIGSFPIPAGLFLEEPFRRVKVNASLTICSAIRVKANAKGDGLD